MSQGTSTVTVMYCGPLGQESPMFGPLEPGERYQCEAALAEYLVKRHPDYWKRPAPVPVKPAPTTEA